jgi:hypothetical protein
VQGAFILVGSNTIGVELLVVVALGVAVYAAWRFWEAIVGQGTDAAYGHAKNFFKFRSVPTSSSNSGVATVPETSNCAACGGAFYCITSC